MINMMGQTFTGEARTPRRPIGFGCMLCTSEHRISMQGPGTVDCHISVRWIGEGECHRPLVNGHASLDTRLHSPHAAASLVYSPALCWLPWMKDDCARFSCTRRVMSRRPSPAGRLSRSHSYALLTWTVGRAAYWNHAARLIEIMPLSDY